MFHRAFFNLIIDEYQHMCMCWYSSIIIDVEMLLLIS